MPSQFAWETPACVGWALSDLLTLLYWPDTLCVVPNGSTSEIRLTPRLSLWPQTPHKKRVQVVRADEKLTPFVDLNRFLEIEPAV
jgi:hypothetical protein